MNDKRRSRRVFSASAYLGVVLVVVAAFVLASSAIALADDSGLPPTTTVSPALTGTIANGVSASLTATDFAPSSGVKYVFYNKDNTGVTTSTVNPTTVIFNTVGNHSLVYYSQDTSGNTEASHLASFVVSDTQPPWSTLGTDFNSVYSDTATISITATDTFTGLGNAYAYIGSGVKNTFYKLSPASSYTTYTTALVVPKAGDYTLQYYSRDNSGNVEATQTAFFTVADGTAPVTTSNAVALYNMTAAITLTPSDGVNGSGIAGTFYKVDSASTYTSGTAVSVTSLGAHTLTFYSVDLAGNQESPAKTVSFTISDLLAPSVLSNALSTYDGPAAITITANDTGTGVAHIYYKLDGGSTVMVTATSAGVRAASIPQIASFTIPSTTGPGAGSHTGLTGQTPTGTNCSCHGAVSSTIATISSSAVVPSGHFEAVPSTACNNCHHVVAATPAPQATFSTVVNVAASGDHTLEFWADDAASPVNTSGHLSASFHVDNAVATPPVTTSDAVASYTGSATIHLSATGGTGALSTFYKLDAAAYVSGTVVSTSVLGSHTLSFYSADSTNNTETAHTVTFTVVSGGSTNDTTPPNTISDALSSYDNGGPAVIHLTATDSQSGIKATYYTVDGGAVTTVTAPAASRHAASIPAIASFTIPSTTGPGAGSHAGVLGQTPTGSNCVCHGAVSTTIAAITASAVVPSGHFEAVPATPCNNCHVVTSSGGGGTPAGPASFTTTVTVSGVGSHSLVFWSVDASGNAETHKTADFTIQSGETTPQVGSLSKVPQRRSITVVRHHGVGRFQFAAILRGPDDVGIPGKTILLQKSADGVNFTTVRGANFVGDDGGRVVVHLEFRSPGTGIWRWLFAGDSQWAATSTSKTWITVK